MCYKVILRMSMFIPDGYKDQKVYSKAVDSYPRALKSVHECHKT